MKYAAEFPVRFGDIDNAGVVYYPVFFHYFHQALESWFGDALGVPYVEVVRDRNLGFPSVQVETEFKSPLRFGDTVRIELEILDIGKRSLAVGYTAIRLPDGVVAARAKITTVAIDNDTFTSISIPADLRDCFERFRSGRSEADG